jgi:hypothetical protein
VAVVAAAVVVVALVAVMRMDHRRAGVVQGDVRSHPARTRRSSDRAPAHRSVRSVIYNGFK